MTNEPINMTATNARRIAAIRALRNAPPPIMPAGPIRRLPPKTRRNSVPHRAIR